MGKASLFCAIVTIFLAPALHAQAIRDSAGLRIIDNRTPAWNANQKWRISAKPTAIIGEEEGDPPYLLSRVYSATRLPNGEIVIGDSGSGELRFFDTNGKFLRKVGRKGAGPGEFHQYSSLILCKLPRNELLAADAGQGRLHVFSNNGEYKKTITLQHDAEASVPGLHGCFGDGTTLMRNVAVASLGGAPGTLIPGSMQYFRYTANGRPISKLAVVPHRTRYVHQYGSITHYPYVPLTAESYGAVSSNAAYLNQQGLPQIERYGMNGKLDALIRWQVPRVRTSTIYRRYTSESVARMNEQMRGRYAALFAKKLPVPDLVPVVGNMTVDGLGYLWVKRYQLPWERAATFDVFDPNGRWLGTLTAPERLEVYEIGKDYVLGRQRDDLDVERVAVYALDRRSSSR